MHIQVRLWNFMTHAYAEFEPGPGLNVIIGPNGTGKSTVVCAICLVLNGKPSVRMLVCVCERDRDRERERERERERKSEDLLTNL